MKDVLPGWNWNAAAPLGVRRLSCYCGQVCKMLVSWGKMAKEDHECFMCGGCKRPPCEVCPANLPGGYGGRFVLQAGDLTKGQRWAMEIWRLWFNRHPYIPECSGVIDEVLDHIIEKIVERMCVVKLAESVYAKSNSREYQAYIYGETNAMLWIGDYIIKEALK